MKIKMLTSMAGVDYTWHVGDVVEVDDKTGKRFIEHNVAEPVSVAKPKRARNKDGTLKADDPDTSINEAWTDGVGPKRETASKKSPRKRTATKG